MDVDSLVNIAVANVEIKLYKAKTEELKAQVAMERERGERALEAERERGERALEAERERSERAVEAERKRGAAVLARQNFWDVTARAAQRQSIPETRRVSN